ncbi:MAG: PDGLE domain-containing protein [Candidatus Ranarchaeia archaeon]
MSSISDFFSKKMVAATAILLLALGLLIPLASSAPDGLEAVAEQLGVHETGPLYLAPFHDYLLQIGNDLIGTWLAGITGVALIILVFFFLFLIYRGRKSE